jgi:hypothetical protein
MRPPQYIHSHDHVIPFENKVFEEVIFLLKYHQNPLSPQDMEHKKRERERENLLKKERKREKKRKKKKSSRSLFK